MYYYKFLQLFLGWTTDFHTRGKIFVCKFLQLFLGWTTDFHTRGGNLCVHLNETEYKLWDWKVLLVKGCQSLTICVHCSLKRCFTACK